MINEQLWIGHFDLWTQPGLVMFRQALILAGCMTAHAGAVPGHAGQRQPTLASAISRRSSIVVWAGKSAREAIDAVMFDTQGEA